jgi:hypothetical protein
MKGFKKDGKFRPTGNKSNSSLSKTDLKKREKHSQPKCSECGRKMGMLQTDKCDTCQAKPKEEGKWEITETKYGRDKKTIEPKLDPRVVQQTNLGNETDEAYWEVKDVRAYPEIDGKTIPVKFVIQTYNQKHFDSIYSESDEEDEVEEYNFDEKNDYYTANLFMLPVKFGKKTHDSISRMAGLPEGEEFMDFDAIIGGYRVDVDSSEEQGEINAINEVVKNVEAVSGLIGFYLDKRWNMIGNNGWDTLKEIALDERVSNEELFARNK